MWVRRVAVSSSYAGPQTSTSSVRCVSSRPRFVMSDVSSPNSIGVRWTSAPSTRTTWAARSSSRPSARSTGSSRLGGRPAQRRGEARDELARAERLRDVVVGAGLQRTDLLLLLADGRQHDDRRLRPLAQRPGHLDAVAVGQHEVDDRGVRRMERREVERLLRRRRGHGLEPGVAQDDAQRPQDLRLVVDDEDATALARSPDGRRDRRRAGTRPRTSCPARAATRPRSSRRSPRRSRARSPGRGPSPR